VIDALGGDKGYYHWSKMESPKRAVSYFVMNIYQHCVCM